MNKEKTENIRANLDNALKGIKRLKELKQEIEDGLITMRYIQTGRISDRLGETTKEEVIWAAITATLEKTETLGTYIWSVGRLIDEAEAPAEAAE